MLLPKDIKIPAILMAAGKSTRMGKNKLLLPFDDHSVIAETCDRLLASHVSKVIVVLGNDQDKVREQLANKNVEFVINPNYADGMMTSLQAGMSYLPIDAKFFMVALGDQPLVTTSVYNTLIEATAYTSHKIFIPTYGRERGNPIVLSSEFIDEMLEMDGDVGGRVIIKKYPEEIQEIPVINEGIVINMNTPELYEYWMNEYKTGRRI